MKIAGVGYPNVGKSTQINRRAGNREAVTHDQPGATRDRKEIACEWNGVEMTLIDTGGVDLSAGDRLSRSVQDQAREAITDSDAILHVIDARAGLGPGDAEVAALLRGAGKPVIVVANKVDNPRDFHLSAELYSLGLGDPATVSAVHGLGTGDLLDRMAALHDPTRHAVESDAGLPRVAILGRPNVGKSSLLNALLGSQRTIVSELAGTTRDPIDTKLSLDGRELILVDTAGIRKRSKITGSIDYYAQIRAERAAERADVAILLCDASVGVTSEDLRIGELAMKAGCATLVGLNKWDIVEVDLDDAKERLSQRLRLRPPVLTCSAERGRNLPKLLPVALELADKRASRLKTPELNKMLGEAVSRQPPPAKRGKRLRTYYIAQVGTSPPRFAIQVNDRALINRDWAFYLENSIREAFELDGVPLVIDYVPRQRSGGQRRSRSL